MSHPRNGYRHELKYLVDERDLALISAAIAPLTKPDAYHPEGAYRIRSVYYDDPWNNALRSNLDGISPRSKYRIRMYGRDIQTFHLEKKTKDHDLTCKRDCVISQEECRRLLTGQKDRGFAEQPCADRPLLKGFEANASDGYLRPVVVVEYERTAFTCREGNVRITFDRNLASSLYVLRFEDEDLPKRPVMPTGQQLLEIKYDEFLPGYLRKALNTGKLKRTTFSKYTMCRMSSRLL